MPLEKGGFPLRFRSENDIKKIGDGSVHKTNTYEKFLHAVLGGRALVGASPGDRWLRHAPAREIRGSPRDRAAGRARRGAGVDPRRGAQRPAAPAPRRA